MLRIFVFMGCLIWSSLGLTQTHPRYQVDMIVFTHLQPATPSSVQTTSDLHLVPNMTHAIPLKNDHQTTALPYHTLPISASQLRNEYWALNRKPDYQILFHYTWLQPSNNQKAIALPQSNGHDWNVEGTLRIRQSNYYLFDTDLLFSAPNNTQPAFVFSKKQRLKPEVVYYLDHPQAGMLIKIHRVA